jgi:hypothetical protein
MGVPEPEFTWAGRVDRGVKFTVRLKVWGGGGGGLSCAPLFCSVRVLGWNEKVVCDEDDGNFGWHPCD